MEGKSPQADMGHGRDGMGWDGWHGARAWKSEGAGAGLELGELVSWELGAWAVGKERERRKKGKKGQGSRWAGWLAGWYCTTWVKEALRCYV